MPPLKTIPSKKCTASSGTENSVVKTINTRSSKGVLTVKKENPKDTGPFSKRKAASPIKGNTLKRSALGNITNAIETKCVINSGNKTLKKPVSSTVTKPTVATTAKISLPASSLTKTATTVGTKPPLPKSRLTLPLRTVAGHIQSRPSVHNTNAKPGCLNVPVKPPVAEKPDVQKPVTKHSPAAARKSVTNVVATNKCRVVAKPKGTANKDPLPHERRSTGRRSTLESTNSSLYVSALSDVLDEDETQTSSTEEVPESLPAPLINIDEEYLEDPFQCATYVRDIFEYLKSRENDFKICDYIDMQVGLSRHVRAILVDWMVEIQENFELNHETLYLGVKLVDTYLSKVRVSKQCLQLVGCTAMLIAAKYDERIPPAIGDFLYICDNSYKRKDILKMEVNILRVTHCELGFPLSYRFLRRFARCAKVPMPLLTLARFILEYTLMDYSTVTLSDSKMAAAALYLAFKMKKEQQWDNTLIHFSGYRVRDFIDIVYTLNDSLHQTPRHSLSTIRNKYSHKIFYEVAKTPLVNNEDL